MRVSLVPEVFHDPDGPERLLRRLERVRAEGAELAVLPELPLNAWSPASRVASAEDGEGPDGPRQRAQARAAREAGVALLGGVILADPRTGRRHNTALLFDPSGRLLGGYRKLHLPSEEGFWESDHYEPGDEVPAPIDLLGFALGIQICSDANRPEASHILGALGALAVLVPRATPPETYDRWRTVLRANAVTSGLYVVSVNRPGPEPGTSLGGPSLVVAPDGAMLLETDDPGPVPVPLRRWEVEAARRAYPGYLPVRADVYGRGWTAVAAGPVRERVQGTHAPAAAGPDPGPEDGASIDTNLRQG